MILNHTLRLVAYNLSMCSVHAIPSSSTGAEVLHSQKLQELCRSNCCASSPLSALFREDEEGALSLSSNLSNFQTLKGSASNSVMQASRKPGVSRLKLEFSRNSRATGIPLHCRIKLLWPSPKLSTKTWKATRSGAPFQQHLSSTSLKNSSSVQSAFWIAKTPGTVSTTVSKYKCSLRLSPNGYAIRCGTSSLSVTKSHYIANQYKNL